MRTMTLRFPLRLARVAVIALIASCGSGDFAGQHFEELQKDCAETLRCMSLAGTGDVMEKCVDEAGKKLGNASQAVQQDFVDRVDRCGTLQVCDYVSCTQSDPNVGYAELHRDDVIAQCQQTVGCTIASGGSVAKTAVDDCIGQLANQLNFGTAQQQAQFEGKAARCHGLMACAWVNCP